MYITNRTRYIQITFQIQTVTVIQKSLNNLSLSPVAGTLDLILTEEVYDKSSYKIFISNCLTQLKKWTLSDSQIMVDLAKLDTEKYSQREAPSFRKQRKSKFNWAWNYRTDFTKSSHRNKPVTSKSVPLVKLKILEGGVFDVLKIFWISERKLLLEKNCIRVQLETY